MNAARLLMVLLLVLVGSVDVQMHTQYGRIRCQPRCWDTSETIETEYLGRLVDGQPDTESGLHSDYRPELVLSGGRPPKPWRLTSKWIYAVHMTDGTSVTISGVLP